MWIPFTIKRQAHDARGHFRGCTSLTRGEGLSLLILALSVKGSFNKGINNNNKISSLKNLK
jgi:hypothetical protein